MAEDISTPDPSLVLDLLEAFRRSKVMFAALKLGIFDRLHKQPDGCPELAAAIPANADALERLLDACVGLGLLARKENVYHNTPVAETYLCSQSPRRMTGYLNFSNDVVWPLWSHLEDAVREGTARWKQTYGWDGPLFDNLFHSAESMREFLMGMNGFGVISSPHVVEAFDLSRFRRFVDLGGATGHLAVAACRRYPHFRATVFDLPGVVPLCTEMVSQSGVADRIDIVGGDFFADSLPEGDLYAVSRILHDWTEEKIQRLLGRMFDALPSGGGLLVAEKMLWDDKTGPRWAQMQSLNMLCCAEGKERTLGEYEALLQQAGFGKVTGCRTSSPIDAILAVKP